MSLIDDLMSAIGGVGYALDTPRALTFGLLAGQPGERVGGRELLEQYGLAAPNEEGLDLGDALGFGLEVVGDPLNLLGGGLLGKSALAGRQAAKQNAIREAMLGQGAMPEEIYALTKAKNPTYHGTGYVFDKPDMSRADPNALYGPGYYTTENPAIASEYAEEAAQRFGNDLPLNVRKHLLDVRTPFDVDAAYTDLTPFAGVQEYWRQGWPDVDANSWSGEEIFKALEEIRGGPAGAGQAIRDAGFDSIKHIGGQLIGSGVDHPVWIALDPGQIYSPFVAPVAAKAPRSTGPLAAALLGHNVLARGSGAGVFG